MVDEYNRQAISALVKRHFGDELEETPLKDTEFIITEKGLVNVELGAYMRRSTQNGLLPVKFGRIFGDFSIANAKLVSLDGCPRIVDGHFDCSYNQLKSLVHSPQDVESFDCSNNLLTSLEGAPPAGTEEFVCNSNLLPDLTSAPATKYLAALNNPFQNFRGTPSHIESVAVTWRRDLPLLGLLTVKDINIHFHNGTHYDEIEQILKQYASQGRAGMIDCKRELVAAGFEGNARY